MESRLLQQTLDSEIEAIRKQSDSPEAAIKILSDEVRFRQNGLAKDSALVSAELSELMYQLNDLDPTVVLNGSMLDKPQGIPQVVGYVLIGFVSVFLALALVVLSAFAEKVKQRQTDEG